MFFQSFSQRFTQQYIVVLVATALVGSFVILLSGLHLRNSHLQSREIELSSSSSQRIQPSNDDFKNIDDVSLVLPDAEKPASPQGINAIDQTISLLAAQQHRLRKRARIDATWRQIRMFLEDPIGPGQAYLLQSIAAIFDFVSSLEEIVAEVQQIGLLHDHVVTLRDAENNSPSPMSQLFAQALEDLAASLDEVPPNLVQYTEELLQTIIGVTEPWESPITMVKYLFAIDDPTVNEITDDWIGALISTFQVLGQELREWVAATLKAAIYADNLITQNDPYGTTAQGLQQIRDVLGPIGQRWADLANTADSAEENLEKFKDELVNVYLLNDEPTIPSSPSGNNPNSGSLLYGGGIFGMIDRSPDEVGRAELFGEQLQPVYDVIESNPANPDMGQMVLEEGSQVYQGESPRAENGDYMPEEFP
ncbi:hypothetical protein ABW21_db0207331 [Orbilia brochopaga]|nr:hypothetical protein ABW21_db0207331 [Drechslerella brochopaga]